MYSRTMPRVLWWSEGGGAVSYERGTPVINLTFCVQVGQRVRNEQGTLTRVNSRVNEATRVDYQVEYM